MRWLRRRRAASPLDTPSAFAERHARLGALLGYSTDFWKSTVDWNQGGFFGLVDYSGRPGPDANKDMMQQVRHLWTFSEIYRFEEDSDEIKAICDHQFKFVRDCFFVPERSGFHGVVSASGEPVAADVHLYHFAFGIFSLANYALAFPDSPDGREALRMAAQVFFNIIQASFDHTDGFDENIYPGHWCNDAKEINTQMHLLEAISYLLEACRLYEHPDAGEVENILNKQLSLVYMKGIVNQDGHYFASRGYDRDWSVVDNWEVDYGHEIEVVFLIMLAASLLGRDREPELVNRVVKLGQRVCGSAFDSVRGKWFYSGNPISGKVVHKVANIWTNFEALNGLSTMYDLTGEIEYLNKYDQTIHWLETKQFNVKVGEWYYNVNNRGRPMKKDVYTGDCGWMTYSWKSSYHSTRALITQKRWLAAIYLKPDQ